MKFREIAQKLGIETAPENHHHARAGWINIDCPNCGRNTRKFHLGFNEAYGFLNCWKCGRHRLADTLADISGQPLGEVLRLIKDITYRPTPERRRAGKLIVPKGVGPLSPAHCAYLRRRWFDSNKLSRIWELKGIGLAARLAWRIYIPIIYRGITVSWTTRAIGEEVTRYISASPNEEAIDQKTLLYGEDYARNSIIIVEGPIDCWALGPGTAATLGTGYTKAQVLKMARYPKRAVCFDNEPKAQERARMLADHLSMFPGETLNIILDAKDAASASERERRKVRKAVLGTSVENS